MLLLLFTSLALADEPPPPTTPPNPNRTSGPIMCANLGAIVTEEFGGIPIGPCIGYRVYNYGVAVHIEAGAGPGLYHEESALTGEYRWNRRDFFNLTVGVQWFPIEKWDVGLGMGETVEMQVVSRMADAITRNYPYGAVAFRLGESMVAEFRLGYVQQYENGLYLGGNFAWVFGGNQPNEN